MGGFETLASALGLSFASGVNLYATVLILGLIHRLGWTPMLPESLAELVSNPWVLSVAGFAYVLEFFADKIPWVNTLWDGVHTLVRPLGAGFLALGAAEQLGPTGQMIAMLLGGSVALGSHATKAAARMSVNSAAPEPITNSVISVAEDVGVAGLVALAFANPVAAIVVLGVLVAAMLWLLPLLLRSMCYLLRSVWGLVASAAGAVPSSASWMPEWLEHELGEGDWRVYPAYARSVRGMPLLAAGYLCTAAGQAVFVRQGLFRKKKIRLGEIKELSCERGLLADSIVGVDGKAVEIRIALAKDWARLYREGDDGGRAPAYAAG